MNAGALVVSELGHVLLFVALISHLGLKLSARQGGRVGAWIGFALGALASLLPGEWNPAFYTRAILGEPGALGWLLMLHWLAVTLRGRRLLAPRDLRAVAIVALGGAVLIYPASLGVPGWPDFYQADFGGFALPTVALGFGLVSAWRGRWAATAGVSLGLLLYGLDLHESANLWDCLFDFPSVVASVVILIQWVRSHRRLRAGRDGASVTAA